MSVTDLNAARSARTKARDVPPEWQEAIARWQEEGTRTGAVDPAALTDEQRVIFEAGRSHGYTEGATAVAHLWRDHSPDGRLRVVDGGRS